MPSWRSGPAGDTDLTLSRVEDRWREHVWRPLLRRSGLRYRRIHTLRHTYASLLLERRASLAYVSEQLGHASSSVTLRVYTHPIPREGRRAVDDLDTHESASLAHEDTLTPREMQGLVYRG